MEHPTTDLIAYLQGELAADQRERLEGHLAACADCRGERDACATLLAALRASVPTPPEVHWGRWQSELRGRLQARRGGRRRWLRPVPVAVTAGLVGALLVVAWLGGERPDPRPNLPSIDEVVYQSSAVEQLDLLEDIEVIHQLDRLAAYRDR